MSRPFPTKQDVQAVTRWMRLQGYAVLSDDTIAAILSGDDVPHLTDPMRSFNHTRKAVQFVMSFRPGNSNHKVL